MEWSGVECTDRRTGRSESARQSASGMSRAAAAKSQRDRKRKKKQTRYGCNNDDKFDERWQGQ